jgi:hypothetical protein
MHKKSPKSFHVNFWTTQQSSKCIWEMRSILYVLFQKRSSQTVKKSDETGARLGTRMRLYTRFSDRRHLLVIGRVLHNKQRRSIFGPPALWWRDISDLARIDVFTAVVMVSNILEISSTRQEHILEDLKSPQSYWAAGVVTAVVGFWIVIESRHISKSFNELAQ